MFEESKSHCNELQSYVGSGTLTGVWTTTPDADADPGGVVNIAKVQRFQHA